MWGFFTTTLGIRGGSLRMKALRMVVLPVPTSPVITTKPLASLRPYSRCARASLWPGLMYRNLGSGVMENGLS